MCTAMEIVNGCECVSVWYTDSKYVRRDGMEDEESLETEFHLLSHVLHYYRCVVIFPCTAARVRNMPNIHRFSECIIKWPLFICVARKFDCSLEYLSNVNRFFTCINCVHRRSFTFYPVFFSLSLGWIFYQFRLNWRYQTHSSNDTLPLSTFQSFDATRIILISIENKCSMSFIGHWPLPIIYQSAEVKLELLRFILNLTRKCIWIAFDQKPLGSFAFTHVSNSNYVCRLCSLGNLFK